MKSILNKLRIVAAIMLFVQVAIVVVLVLILTHNLFSFKDSLTPIIIIGIFSALTIANILFVIIAFLKINKHRHIADLHAAEIIGSDIQEAYNFGQLGLVIVDQVHDIIWTNELFVERQIDVIDENIFSWQPQLRDLVDRDDVPEVKITINNRVYEVEYLREAGLFIFKDVTEYEEIFNYSKEHAPVVGMIIFDNYADISVNLEDSRLNDLLADARKIVFDYARKYGILLRRFRTDAYFFFTSYKVFEKMKEDEYRLIDEIREAGIEEETVLTISMGIAYDFPDVVKLNEMASNAIDVAMSRGGDQVVIAQYGQELMFYGGKSEAQEKRNRVKVRVLADSLITLIKNSSNVLIMSHADMDLDALGSALGVKAIADALEKTANIVYDSKLTEKKTRIAFQTMFTREELSKIVVSTKECISLLKPNTLVVITDVHKPSMTLFPKLLENASKVVVIDHHRRAEEFIESPVFSYIEPSASSASELVAEMVRYNSSKLSLPASYATIMLSGILLDTNYYRAKTGIRTFEASMILKEYGADGTMADDFLKEEYEEYALKTKIMSNSKTPYTGIVVTTADPKDYIDRSILAKVAAETINIKGINACFVIGNSGEKETRISGRSDGTINVQLLLEKLGGGGHFTGAAVCFNNSTVEKAQEELLNILELYLPEARISSKKK